MLKYATALLACAIAAPSVSLAGDLNPPPGPVAPTMKSLDEVEPRTAINDENTPGNSTTLYRIVQPGSYYLPEDVEVSGGVDGIQIAVDEVTIDLNGFTLRRTGSSTTVDNGIDASGRSNIAVLNGRVDGFRGNGIVTGPRARIVGVTSTDNFLFDGIKVGDESFVKDCLALNNQQDGIDVGFDSLVVGCLSDSNNSNGYRVASGTTVRECVASDNFNRGFRGGGTSVRYVDCVARNNGSIGFSAANSSSASGCVAQDNDGAGFDFAGSPVFRDCLATSNLGDGFVILGGGDFDSCTAGFNTGAGFDIGESSSITNCSSEGNTGDGIRASSGSTIIGCTSNENTLNGIDVTNGCTVKNNTLRSNDDNGIGAVNENYIYGNVMTDHVGSFDITDGFAIRVTGSENRIDSNHGIGGSSGIQVLGTGNTIVRNSISTPTGLADYVIDPGNEFAPVNPVATAGPWDNL